MPINTAAIYADLKKINARTERMSFPEIPSPPFLQGLLFDCEMHTGKVEKFYIEVTEEMDAKERLLRNLKTTVEIKKRQALISNESVKKFTTGKEREAAVDDLLEDEHKQLLSLENDVASLAHLETIIRHVQSNLNRTNANVRMLAKLMEQQINRLNVGLPSDPETKDLMAGLDEASRLEDEMGLDDVESVTESVMPIEDAGGAEATSALTAPTPNASTTSDAAEDIDVTELFLSGDTEEDPEGDKEVSVAETPAEEPVKEQQAAQSKTAAKGAQTNKGQPAEADESVVVVFDGGGLDLDDIDALVGSTPAKTTPIAEPPKQTVVQKTAAPPKPKEEKAAPKAQKAEPKKDAEDNLDIDDILNSMN